VPDVACKQVLCVKYTCADPSLVSDRKAEIGGESSLASKLTVKVHLLHLIFETE